MGYRLDFDSQLPDLPLAFDLEGVARLFEQHWPGSGPVTIVRCKLQDTKYRPGVRCVNAYELWVASGVDAVIQTVGVVEVTPTGLHLRLYDSDPQLPALLPASDPATMQERFAALSDSVVGGPITGCQVTPVRYKPGARCVFRYTLDTPNGAQVFYGKLLGEGGEQLIATVRALHAASEANDAMPRIPEPLVYWPDLQMLVQPNVIGGAELNDLAFDQNEASDRREQWLHAAGAGLAAIHGSPGAEGPQRSLAADLRELRDYLAPMAIADAALAERYEDAIGRLDGLAAQRPELTAVPSHGAFRTDQYLIGGDRLVMIDMDTFCWSSPARDIGNFLSYLRWKAIRKPQDAAFIDRVGGMFAEGYRAAGAPLDERWLALYEAASLLKIAGRRYRSLTVKEWHLVPQLLDTALAALE